MNYEFIKVRIIADSISDSGTRLTTFELEYPRYIHAEIMTHRVFSRNAQSSRAVPVEKQLERIRNSPVVPIEWGKNKSGMSSSELLSGYELEMSQIQWQQAVECCANLSENLQTLGLHKQWANRITEPFSTIKVVITATEWDNFFWLRYDADAAQPEIVELARLMKEAMDYNSPEKLSHGEWHVPYVNTSRTDAGVRIYYDENINEISLEEALKISASCCAQVSYRKLDSTKEKAIEIYERLFSGPKPHLSPVEHQGTPVPEYDEYASGFRWPKGVTHQDRNQDPWSANFRDWIQHRQVLDTI